MDWNDIVDHRIGAFFTFPLFVLWLARRHLARLARSLVHAPRSREDAAYRWATVAFLAGLGGMFLWLLWVNVPPAWAAGLSIAGFLYALCLTRVIAETGLPLFFPDTNYLSTLVNLVPRAAGNAAAAYFSGILSVWYGPGQRVCVATVLSQAIGMKDEDRAPRHAKLGALFMLVIIVSIVGAGAIQLHMVYHHSTALPGTPIAWWGRSQFWLAERQLLDFVRGVPSLSLADRAPGILFGSGLMLALYTLCQLSPRWPIHPIGMMGVGTWCLGRIWPNIFIGWLLKSLLLRYGGPRVHRGALPVFVGLIMGEIFAMIFWLLVAAVRAGMGLQYMTVEILPI